MRITQRVSGSIVLDEGDGLVATCVAGASILPAYAWEIEQGRADDRLVRMSLS